MITIIIYPPGPVPDTAEGRGEVADSDLGEGADGRRYQYQYTYIHIYIYIYTIYVSGRGTRSCARPSGGEVRWTYVTWRAYYMIHNTYYNSYYDYYDYYDHYNDCNYYNYYNYYTVSFQNVMFSFAA